VSRLPGAMDEARDRSPDSFAKHQLARITKIGVINTADAARHATRPFQDAFVKASAYRVYRGDRLAIRGWFTRILIKGCLDSGEKHELAADGGSPPGRRRGRDENARYRWWASDELDPEAQLLDASVAQSFRCDRKARRQATTGLLCLSLRRLHPVGGSAMTGSMHSDRSGPLFRAARKLP